jgi:hypothetical protein
MPRLSKIGAAALGAFGWTATAAAAPQVSDPYYPYVTMLLPGNGTNGAQNNTFLDSSTNNYSLTRNGNTTQGTISPFGSNWSNYFDGSTSYFSLGTNSAYTFSSGSWTYEGYIYQTGGGGYKAIFTAGNEIQLYVYNDALELYVNNGGYFVSGLRTSSNSVPIGSWVHFALVRNSSNNTYKMYINGVEEASQTTATNATVSTTNFTVGIYGPSPTYYFNGYISNFRATAAAVYTGTFTPSTVPLTAISGTGLLTCQSNRFIDNSTNNFTITTSGAPSVQRFSPFNPTASYTAATIGGSGYFDGSGDYLTTSSSQVIPTGSFTLEAWVYTTSLNSVAKNIISQGSTGNSGRTALSIESSKWWFQIGSDYVNFGTPILGQWNYVAMTYNSSTSTIQGYVNGVSQGSVSHGGDAQNTTLSIGRDWNSADWNGYISSARISNTVRTVTSIPTSPFSNDGNTTFLTNFTNAGIPDYSMMNNLETVGNAQVSTTQSNFGTGSMYFDGTGDWLFTPSKAAITTLVGNFTVEMWIYRESGNNYFFSVGDTQTASGIEVYIGSSGTALNVYAQSGTRITTSPFAATTWTHMALVRSGTTITLYVSGSSVGTWTSSATFSGAIYVGAEFNSGSVTGSMYGYIDDFRITSGYARYTSTFTPPTSAFPTF